MSATVSHLTGDTAGDVAARVDAAGLDWIVPAWPAPRGVHALFTTRNAIDASGVRTSSFDVGRPVAPADDAGTQRTIALNRRVVERLLPSAPRWLDQVHGAAVVDADVDRRQRSPADARPRADAAITRTADVVLAIRVADCLPALFAAADGSVLGAAHAGWRGLAAGVLENTVAAMNCPPAGIVAWLGPCIGAPAYEVGDDVRDAFLRHDARAAAAFARGRPGKWHADLCALATRRLAGAGVTSVHGAALCTASDPARFFSFRRDGSTGRMAAFVWRASR